MTDNISGQAMTSVNAMLKQQYPYPYAANTPKYWLIEWRGQVHVRGWEETCCGRCAVFWHSTDSIEKAIIWIQQRESRLR